ncbi:MAG: hypothetical protein C0603_03530 [Denitrovibrio sp.]|nr:MAG: hypothetical protein C0603_03530 [Denitrovibrio sp.]
MNRLKRLFNSKSILVYIVVALSFHLLFKYRANVNAIHPGVVAPNLAFETLDGQKFNLHDYNMPVMLIFLNTKTLLSSSVYPDLLLRRMPRLKLLEQRNYSGLIVILDTKQDAKSVEKTLNKKKYKVLENTVYLSNIQQAKESYGLSSWPHFFLIDSDHIITYESKLPSMERIDTILKGR